LFRNTDKKSKRTMSKRKSDGVATNPRNICQECKEPIGTRPSRFLDGRNKLLIHRDCHICHVCCEFMSINEFNRDDKGFVHPDCMIQNAELEVSLKSLTPVSELYNPDEIQCYMCRRMTTEPKILNKRKKKVCPDCYENDTYQLGDEVDLQLSKKLSKKVSGNISSKDLRASAIRRGGNDAIKDCTCDLKAQLGSDDLCDSCQKFGRPDLSPRSPSPSVKGRIGGNNDFEGPLFRMERESSLIVDPNDDKMGMRIGQYIAAAIKSDQRILDEEEKRRDSQRRASKRSMHDLNHNSNVIPNKQFDPYLSELERSPSRTFGSVASTVFPDISSPKSQKTHGTDEEETADNLSISQEMKMDPLDETKESLQEDIKNNDTSYGERSRKLPKSSSKKSHVSSELSLTELVSSPIISSVSLPTGGFRSLTDSAGTLTHSTQESYQPISPVRKRKNKMCCFGGKIKDEEEINLVHE